jgi:hypothetical protein
MRVPLIALLLLASMASAAGQTLPEGIENDPKLGLWNPVRIALDNQPQIVKILVLQPRDRVIARLPPAATDHPNISIQLVRYLHPSKGRQSDCQIGTLPVVFGNLVEIK